MTKGTLGSPFFELLRRHQPAFRIRLLLRHWVQTRIRLGAPSTSTRTDCRLGYQRRLVLLLAWLTLLPVTGPLAHTAQTRAIRSILRLNVFAAAPKPNGGMAMKQPAAVELRA
jgi:hypothetical protein